MKIRHAGIMKVHAMKYYILFALLALASLPFRANFAQAPSSTPVILAQSGINCGIKPLPRLGYRIGRCINGQWEQVSDRGTSGINCGTKPLPRLGYRIGRCINGQWEQVSDRGTSGINCGIKPLPRIGYRIGRCINGQWEQVSL